MNSRFCGLWFSCRRYIAYALGALANFYSRSDLSYCIYRAVAECEGFIPLSASVILGKVKEESARVLHAVHVTWAETAKGAEELRRQRQVRISSVPLIVVGQECCM